MTSYNYYFNRVAYGPVRDSNTGIRYEYPYLDYTQRV
jgi:hypothetical protein